MLFSSTVFLFAFLPIVLASYFLVRSTEARNALLLLASLTFYAWGEFGYVLLLVGSIAANYGFGVWLDGASSEMRRRRVLSLAVAANLGLLGTFKYANFVVDNLNALLATAGLREIELSPVHLPIGISFFTFQALTYVVDIYRRDADSQRNPLRVALYISLFPQLIAGPIVRYRQIALELTQRSSRIQDVAHGARRFVIGLGKKVLIANTLAIPADRIFDAPPGELSAAVAWLGAICFGLQIFFDFSGYTDMALGLGRTFGFHFPENFNRPYTARSIRDFWRRWHMSLSNWFRDYLYIPLGGSRLGSTRTLLNLFLVFFLCGLWHGASWNFVVWGLIHGSFLALERGLLGRLLERAPAAAAHLYTLAVVGVAWVFFRASDLAHAIDFIGAMFGASSATETSPPIALFLTAEVILALLVAAVASSALPHRAMRRLAANLPQSVYGAGRLAATHGILVASAMSLAAGTHNPFIYFRF